MKVIADWLDLKVQQYEDGEYVAYEALSNSQHGADDWAGMSEWLHTLIDDTTKEVEAQAGREGE